MSSDIDFSQFIRQKEPVSKSETEEVDFSKFIREPKPSVLKKAGRIGTQFAIGAAENLALPVELPLQLIQSAAKSKSGTAAISKENAAQMMKFLGESNFGLPFEKWDPKDQQKYNEFKKVLEAKPEELQHLKPNTPDISSRGIAEKITGQDLHPEGVLEKAAHWMGFIKNPTNAKDLLKIGTKPKDLIKAITPGTGLARGLGAGAALQLAENDNYGPMGTMAAAIVGDVLGGGVANVGKALIKPKQSLARLAAVTSNSKNAIKQDLIEASKGKTVDLGTLTDNNIIRMAQARLAASGLTGKPFENMRKQITKEIVEDYESIAKQLGEAEFETLHEAGEIGKESLKKSLEADKAVHEKIYSKVRSRLSETSKVNPINTRFAIRNIEKELLPGSVKSADQQKVLSVIEKLREDVVDHSGNVKPATIQELINNKRALQELVDYELSGGVKNMLKETIRDIEKDILSYGKKDAEFLKEYVAANKKFQEHVKTFRNKGISRILTSQDPMTLMNRMNSVQGIKELKEALLKTPEGKRTYGNLARLKLDQMIGNNMKNNITEQIKSGKFVNTLENPKNRQLIKELLPKESFAKLIKLQKHVGRLQDTANKFLNASQSATAAADLAFAGTILQGLIGVVTGNPWMVKAGAYALGTVGIGRAISNLITDPVFLKEVEEAMMAAQKNNTSAMTRVAKKLTSHVKEAAPAAFMQQKETNQEESIPSQNQTLSKF